MSQSQNLVKVIRTKKYPRYPSQNLMSKKFWLDDFLATL